MEINATWQKQIRQTLHMKQVHWWWKCSEGEGMRMEVAPVGLWSYWCWDLSYDAVMMRHGHLCMWQICIQVNTHLQKSAGCECQPITCRICCSWNKQWRFMILHLKSHLPTNNAQLCFHAIKPPMLKEEENKLLTFTLGQKVCMYRLYTASDALNP